MRALKEFFANVSKAAVAFSGGADSAFLLWAAKKCGCEVRAYYVKTAFQPEFELEDARRLAGELDISLKVVYRDILAVPEAVQNGAERCYYCKKALFNSLWSAVREDGYPVLLDGTNASDDAGDRPGMKALVELQVLSPLRECGITKSEVRRMSKEAGIFTWDKPAYACLATRVPTGVPITEEVLRKIETAEMTLEKMGFCDFRVRLYGNGARIQVREEQLPQILQERENIAGALKKLFPAVLLDLETRAGEEQGGKSAGEEKSLEEEKICRKRAGEDRENCGRRE